MSLYVDIKKDLGGFRLSVKFEAKDGVMGILGPSGCGKSMTLRCIAGVERPDEGRIVLDISGEEKRRLTVDSLLARFSRASGEELLTDRVLIGA